MPSLADLPVSSPEAPVAPAAPEAPVAVPEAAPAALPTPFDAISAGKLPGLQVPPIHKNDGVPDALQTFVVHNLHNLMQAGLDYHDLPNHTTVIFNPDVVTKEQIEKAHADGNLDKLVPTAKAFSAFMAKQAAAPEAASPLGGVPSPVPTPAAPPANNMPAEVAAPPPGVSKARLANLQPPGPGIKPDPVPNRLARRAV